MEENKLSGFFFLNWVKIREKLKRTKVVQKITQINMVKFIAAKTLPQNGPFFWLITNELVSGNFI